MLLWCVCADKEQTEIVTQLAEASMEESRSLNRALAENLELQRENEALRAEVKSKDTALAMLGKSR